MTGLHSQDHDGQAWLFRFRDLQQQISADACPFVAREVPTPRARLNGNIARQTLGKDMTIWDDALLGFGLRVRCSGYKSWVLKFQERKSPRFVTLGSAKEMDAPTARQQARRLLERIALDGLPTKAGQRMASARISPTLRTYLPEFWSNYGVHWKPSTLANNQGYARRELVPVFGDIRLHAITQADVQRWRDDLATRSGVFNRALPIFRSPSAGPA